MIQMSKALETYRKLLRSVDRHITAATGNKLWRDFVRKEFRIQRDPSDVPELLQNAEEYVFMIESVHENKNLLNSYHIAIDKEQQQKQQIRRTAEHVGLRIPEEEDVEGREATAANGLSQ